MRSYQNADKGIGREGEQISVISFGDTGGKRPGCDAHHTISVRDGENLRLWGLGAKLWGQRLNLLILVVDDEPDVEVLFRRLFRRDLLLVERAACLRTAGMSALTRGLV
jgi:hypothetical protein